MIFDTNTKAISELVAKAYPELNDLGKAFKILEVRQSMSRLITLSWIPDNGGNIYGYLIADPKINYTLGHC